MRSTSTKEIFTAIFAGILLSLLIATGVIAHAILESDQRAMERFSGRSAGFSLTSSPTLSQESINTAIQYFKIKIPANINTPTFDPNLPDRGLTIRRGSMSKPIVTIGPDAFSSWALLGSTLAHEVEIHCRQNFIAIHLMDLAGIDGTGFAEREAYGYELRHAKRFGLAPYDQDLIRSTANYYFPRSNFRLAEIPSVKFLMSRLTRLETNSSAKQRNSRNF